MKSRLLDSFEKKFRESGFLESQEADYLARGRENLEALYAEIVGKKYGKLELEYDFRSRFGGIYLPPSRKGMSALADGGIGVSVPP